MGLVSKTSFTAQLAQELQRWLRLAENSEGEKLGGRLPCLPAAYSLPGRYPLPRSYSDATGTQSKCKF